MESRIVDVGGPRVEILTDGERFIGLGKIWINNTLVRSGRLPITVYSQSFTGMELAGLTLAGVDKTGTEIRIRLDAAFTPLDVKLMTDHSLDPIHDTDDWDAPADPARGRFTVVLAPAQTMLGASRFVGFSYRYEYEGDVPLFWIMDKASWELDGDASGVTVYNQSSCSDPVATFDDETFWTTEGELFFADPASLFNRVMTHNLPRWASHQAFDFQFKGDATLLGVYGHVDLIRSVLRRDPGKAEIKTFDKHIFDEARRYVTSPKAILLNTDKKTVTDQRNLWTWAFDDAHRRARAEFGLKEQPPLAILGFHHWVNFTIDTYYKDIVPAMANIGAFGIFAENFKKSDGSELDRLPNGNMCGSKEYVISDRLGGAEKFAEYIRRCQALGLSNYMWTNTYVTLSAAFNADHRAENESCWFMAMNDTRTKYAGAYTCVSSNLDFKNPAARKYFVDCHKLIKDQSNIEGFFVDSFYNLFYMPVDYKTGHPRTHWREALGVMKELQDYGCGWYIESFGAFGQPNHGHPASYSPDRMFICYYVGLGNGYVTIPVPGCVTDQNVGHTPEFIFYEHAHKAPHATPLFVDGRRVDEIYGPEHKRVLQEYTRLIGDMHTRFLQEDDKSVVWHNEAGTKALVWNFETREVALPGRVTDVTSGTVLPLAQTYKLAATHVYAVEAVGLPTRVGS